MLSAKKIAILLVCMMSAVSLTACQKANVSDIEETHTTVLEMEWK